METLTPEEELIVSRLIEELKQHPRLRRPLIEALGMVELLDTPQQLDQLKTLVEQILQKQVEHDARLAHIEQELGVVKQEVQEVKQEAREAKQVAYEAKQAALEAKREAGEAKQVAYEAKQAALDVRERVDRIERDMGILKGNSEELHAAKRLPGVFGKYLRKLRVYDTHQFGLIAEDLFSLSDEDYSELLRADWFAQGRVSGAEREVWLVIEASWGVGIDDVERAHARAAILRQAGVDAYGVAMGRGAAPEAIERARELGVLLALDGSIQNAELLR
jgi:DNA repair exonuclease SbcCD ATPase subunit